MKTIEYQQKAVAELVDKTIALLNNETKRNKNRGKIVFEAPTGAGKTVMACQTLATLVDELQTRGDSHHREVAFVWIAPRKLHLQSYQSIKHLFSETRKLQAVMYDELDQREGILPGQILFVNWESVNKENNLLVRDAESGLSLYEITRHTQQEEHIPIVAIIDEEHVFWSKTADKSAAVLDHINPAVELRISATPKTVHPDALVKVQRQEVIAAEMIKKKVVLNAELEQNMHDELDLNANLMAMAYAKRNAMADAYKQLGETINPLLLIQLPNDSKETLTADDAEIAKQVKLYFEVTHGITTENGKMAIWLANEKENLADLAQPDNMVQVLLFKEAIALGWDCPRAAVLLIFRKLQSDHFTVQTVGRILRMPQQRHYPSELLNTGYVYTDIARDKIQIVAADADYLLNNTITAHRRENMANVSLKTYYAERPNASRNYLGPEFKKVLYRKALEFWRLDENRNLLFSIADLAAIQEDVDYERTDDEVVNDNCYVVQHSGNNKLQLDVKNINIAIPADVYFDNEEQTLEADTVRYARKASEIKTVFLARLSHKGGQFESKGRTDKISDALLTVMENLFGLYDTDAMKTILYHENWPKIERLLEKAFDSYQRERDKNKALLRQNRQMKEYDWEVPEERVYDSETHRKVATDSHALLPFVEQNQASNPEQQFVAFLEEHKEWIDWWYKNGDSGKQHYAIPYGEQKQQLFYVDFVIRMKNGHIYLFDTKSEGSDVAAPDKHNALLQYMDENSTDKVPLKGGILIKHGENWLYSPLPINNTTDTTNWDSFYPENA